MTNDITHDRCSELLGPYARGELSDDDRGAVAAHLESCADCRHELAGLTALLDYPVAGLTGTEVVRLDRAIAAAAGADRRSRAADITPLPVRNDRRSGYAGAVLGAAAVLLVVAVAIGSALVGESDEDAGSGGMGVTTGEDAAREGAAAEGPRPVFGGTQSFAALATESEEASPSAKDRASGEGELFRRDNLARLGGTKLFGEFADAYDAEDAVLLQDRFVAELARGAGEDAGTVTLCTRTVVEASTGPALPVAGTFGRYQGKPALVLGFVHPDRTEGPLNRYSIWVFARRSCDTPLATAAGDVP